MQAQSDIAIISAFALPLGENSWGVKRMKNS